MMMISKRKMAAMKPNTTDVAMTTTEESVSERSVEVTSRIKLMTSDIFFAILCCRSGDATKSC